MSSTRTPGGAPSSAPAGDTASEPRAARPGAKEMALRFLTLREGSIIVVTILAAIYFTVKVPAFPKPGNLDTLLPYFAPFAILAIGEVMLMVAGEIDLSIGSVYLFTPFMFYEFHQAGLPLWVDLLLSLVCAALIGALNGILTVFVGISSFIVTLGTLLGVGGLTLIISGAAPVAMPGAEVRSTTETVTKV